MAIIKATELYVSVRKADPVPVGFAIKAERESDCRTRWLVKEAQLKVLGLEAGVHYPTTYDGTVFVHKDFFDE